MYARMEQVVKSIGRYGTIVEFSSFFIVRFIVIFWCNTLNPLEDACEDANSSFQKTRSFVCTSLIVIYFINCNLVQCTIVTFNNVSILREWYLFIDFYISVIDIRRLLKIKSIILFAFFFEILDINHINNKAEIFTKNEVDQTHIHTYNFCLEAFTLKCWR